MPKFCENCGKELNNPYATHCSDECLFTIIKNSKHFTREYHRRIKTIHELFRARKYHELLKNCSTMIAENSQELEALKYKAYALYFLSRYDEAISWYDKAISLDPENPQLYAGKSKALEKLERHEESRSYFEKAKKMKDLDKGIWKLDDLEQFAHQETSESDED